MLVKKQISYRFLFALGLLGFIGVLMGCAATHTAISKRNLDVQSKMSETVFLDPVSPDKKSIYVQIRNTSDKPEMDITAKVLALLVQRGYQIEQNPEKAHYILQANILQAGKSDLRVTQDALSRGYGAGMSGAVVGATAGVLVSDSPKAVIGAGLLGAALSTVTDAMVKDIQYSVIADLQISERGKRGVEIKEETNSVLKQGNSSTKEITSTEQVNWKRYQTRVVSTANQVNLKFEKALPELISGLSQSIAGIF